MGKAIEIQVPNKMEAKEGYTSVFLAGSIEMGKAEEWQKKIINDLGDESIIFLNPRRDDWDSSWVQSKTNENFKEQVLWELTHLEAADYIILHLDPNTISPISLIEFGLYARKGNLYVYCPEEYWKKGNIDITSEFYDVTQVNSFEELIEIMKTLTTLE